MEGLEETYKASAKLDAKNASGKKATKDRKMTSSKRDLDQIS